MLVTREQMAETLRMCDNLVDAGVIEAAAAAFGNQVSFEFVQGPIVNSIRNNGRDVTPDQIVKEVTAELMAKKPAAPGEKKPGDTRRITREYFDSLLVEQRLIDAVIPDTSVELFGHRFSSPIMTTALSHLGKSIHGNETGMNEYAMGAVLADVLHWVGMCTDEEFRDIMDMGAKTIRVIKPYADEDLIYQQIAAARECGAVGIGMDIDHIFTLVGNCDVIEGKEMEPKTAEQLAAYKKAAGLPFVIKGVLSATDAKKAMELGADGIIISHHGGRLGFSTPPLMVLPEIAAAVKGKVTIIVDCGITSGMDAYKALALGADAVGVGTHLMATIKKEGAKGVGDRLKEMNRELRGVMAFTGVKDTRSFDSTVIHHIR